MHSLHWLSGIALAGAALIGCGDGFVATGATSTGSSSSGSGGGGSAGATGESVAVSSSSSSTGGSTGAGGTLCVAGDLSTCGPKQYCREDTHVCEGCDQLDRLEFADAVAAGITPPEGTYSSFPRAGLATLLFTYRTMTVNETDIGIAATKSLNTWSAPIAAPAPINSMSRESAPLYFAKADAGVLEGLISDKVKVNPGKPILAFDTDRNTGPGFLQVWVFNPVDGTEAVPLNLKGQNGDPITMHLAVAAQEHRFWYLSQTMPNGELRLVTTPDGNNPTIVTINFDNSCGARGDLAPWVTPDGSYLFFSATVPDQGCNMTSDPTSHLFHVKLDSKGQPTSGATAVALFPKSDKSRLTPSLSADACTLFFTEETDGDNAMLYSAVRH